jgi:hypothetical protein
MTAPITQPFNEEEKVRILLNEYGTLRSEILTRTANLYQLGAAAIAMAVWIFGQSRSFGIWFVLVIIGASGLIAYFFWIIAREGVSPKY